MLQSCGEVTKEEAGKRQREKEGGQG